MGIGYQSLLGQWAIRDACPYRGTGLSGTHVPTGAAWAPGTRVKVKEMHAVTRECLSTSNTTVAASLGVCV